METYRTSQARLHAVGVRCESGWPAPETVLQWVTAGTAVAAEDFDKPLCTARGTMVFVLCDEAATVERFLTSAPEVSARFRILSDLDVIDGWFC